MKALLLTFFSTLLMVGLLDAASLEVRVADKEAPADLAPALRELLQNKAIEVLDNGQPIYTFWLRKEVPLKTKADNKALDAIRETAFVGASLVSSPQRDYKDNEIAAGLYTLRYAFQPQDGDHLGTAPFPYFFLLIPAKNDRAPDAITSFKAMTKASGQATATGHPSVLSVRPPSGGEGAVPRVTEPEADHEAVLLKVATRAPEASDAGSAQFELVVRGHSSHL